MPYTTITVNWQNFPGAPGWTRIKFFGALDAAGAQTAANNFKSFLNGFASFIPTGVTLAFLPTAEVYNDSGVLTDVVPIGSVPAITTGSATGKYVGGSGCVIHWITGAIHLGGKVRGRTFMVPLASSAFDTNGTLDNTALLSIKGAAEAFAATTPKLAVSSKKPPDGSGGNLTAQVSTAVVNDKAALLRSRRD
jgi:hypothetical protein